VKMKHSSLSDTKYLVLGGVRQLTEPTPTHTQDANWVVSGNHLRAADLKAR